MRTEEARGLFFLGTSYLDVEEYGSALSYLTEADLILETVNLSFLQARCKISLGCVYREQRDYPKAFYYLDAGAEIFRNLNSSVILARAYNDLANTYALQQEHQKALDYYLQSLEIRKGHNAKQGIISTQLDLSKFHMDHDQLDLAVTILHEALALAVSIKAKSKMARAYQLLSAIYESKGQTKEAFDYFKEYHRIKHEVDQSEAEAKLNNIRLSNQAEQAEQESKFMKLKNKELAEINHKLEETNIELDHEKQKSERLLLNILPDSIAQRLKDGEKLIADSFQEVTVLFADIVGFTQLSAKLTPTELIQFLNGVFLCFDELAARHQLEKIKTIGDAYMVVSGIPQKVDDPNRRMVDMALDMVRAFKLISERIPNDVGIRIGIHCGSAVAGVIGSSKFSYDIWGDTVNLASRMESHSEDGRIHVTEAVYLALKDRYLFEGRGPIEIKGKGKMMTYFLLQE
ncbi:MAG TPA: adenylate/guanylate cyclase domain-containing protein [Bacilli bacterium]